MNARSPFTASDLEELDERVLSRADEVVSMREIAGGANGPRLIGLRHDVDNTFEPCLELAQWEAERGYRATYFILHDAPYWNDPDLQDGLEQISELGHEIGIHTNALTVALLTGRDPHDILHEAIGRLREWGHNITGVVGHGDKLCYRANYVCDEQFVECARPNMGEPDRTLSWKGVDVPLRPRSLASFGLEYESLRCAPKDLYFSDSGGNWNAPLGEISAEFQRGARLHVLQHPCWWLDCFTPVEAAA